MHSADNNPPTVFRRYLSFSFLLILAYAVTGKLGLMLALPPGYASPIFPPAGIAIAVALIAGWKVLPAVFAGSLLLNIWVGYTSNHQINTTGIEVACMIALASTMQAAVGGWWLRRKIAYPTTLDSPADVVNFFVSAPFICLVSASISVSGLLVFGFVDNAHFFTSWASWWVGDFLGVIVMLPLTLVVIGQPRQVWQKRWGNVALPMLITFGLLIVIFVTTSKWERNDSLTEFDGMSNQLSEKLRVLFKSQESVLAQTGELFTFRDGDHITRQDFHNFVHITTKKFTMIYGIEWAPRISNTARRAFVAAQSGNFPGFDIKQLGKDGHLTSADQRDYYYPLTYMEPGRPEMRSILGFDLASIDNRKTTILKAYQENTVVTTPPIKLIINNGTEPGLLLFYAVKRDDIDGVVLTVIKTKDFLGEIFEPIKASLAIRLVDTDADQPLYDTVTDRQAEVLFTRDFEFGTRHYRLEAAPTTLYYEQHRSWQSWSILAIGIFGSGLMGALLLLGTGYTARVLALVDEKTLALKESATRFQEITSNLGEGIYVLDTNGIITFSNAEAQRLLGWREKELLGKNAHLLFHFKRIDHSPYPVDESALLAGIKSGESFKSTDEVFWRKDDNPIHVDITSVPVYRDGQIIGAVVVFDDITARKKIEHALRASEKSFREIIEYAPIGMTIVSLEGKFMTVNQALCDIVGYDTHDLLQLTFQEITYPDDLTADLEYFTQLLAGKIKSYRMEKRYIRKDKKIVWVQLSVSLFRDDDNSPQYFISQIEDITERKHRHQEIEQYAYYDALTNLPNRRMLLNRLQQALSKAERDKSTMALLFLDLDHFKHINDTYGHEAGDTILREVGVRLSKCVRVYDTVSRQGGDEFVIILTEITQARDAELVAEKILTSFQLPINVKDEQFTMSTSIGIAIRSGDMQITTETLMKNADMAMYEAKGAGRNGYQLYVPA